MKTPPPNTVDPGSTCLWIKQSFSNRIGSSSFHREYFLCGIFFEIRWNLFRHFIFFKSVVEFIGFFWCC